MAPKLPPSVDTMVDSLITDAQSRIEKQCSSLLDQRATIQKKREELEKTRNELALQAVELDTQITTCQAYLESVKLLKAQKSGILYP